MIEGFAWKELEPIAVYLDKDFVFSSLCVLNWVSWESWKPRSRKLTEGAAPT